MLQQYAEQEGLSLQELQAQLAYQFALTADQFALALVHPELLPATVADALVLVEAQPEVAAPPVKEVEPTVSKEPVVLPDALFEKFGKPSNKGAK